MSTPTAAQIEALLNFLEEHRDLARENFRSVEGRVLFRRLLAIMGDGFGEPQTSARVPAFIEHSNPGPSTEDNDQPIVQLNDPLPETQHAEPDTQGSRTTPAIYASLTRNTIKSTRRQQGRFRRRSAYLRTDCSVRDRLFQLEELRREREDQRNAELAGIRTAINDLGRLVQTAINDLCRLVQLFIERQ